MFGRIRSQMQCFEGQDQIFNVWKHKTRIPMCGRLGHNSNVWKDKVTIPMFGKIRSEFQYLEG